MSFPLHSGKFQHAPIELNDSKSVCRKLHVGSNPTRCASSPQAFYRLRRAFCRFCPAPRRRAARRSRPRADCRAEQTGPGTSRAPASRLSRRGRALLFHRFQKAQEGGPALRRALVHPGVLEHLRKHQPGLTAHYVHDVLRRDVVFCAEALGPVRVL